MQIDSHFIEQQQTTTTTPHPPPQKKTQPKTATKTTKNTTGWYYLRTVIDTELLFTQKSSIIIDIYRYSFQAFKVCRTDIVK